MLSHIPSNFTLDEILKVVEVPAQVEAAMQSALDEIASLKQEVARQHEYEESIREQLYFCKEYIEEVVSASKSITKAKELSSFIQTTLENSYIEL